MTATATLGRDARPRRRRRIGGWASGASALCAACLLRLRGGAAMATKPDTVVVRQSRCFEKLSISAGSPDEFAPFGSKTKADPGGPPPPPGGGPPPKGPPSKWPDLVTTQCPLARNAMSCALVGAYQNIFTAPKFSIVDDKTTDEKALYKNTQTWLRGAGKGFQPTPSKCAWCESPGSGHGVCVGCDAFQINALEQQGFTCAPHCSAGLASPLPRWEPQKVNPFFPVPPPQHLESNNTFGTRAWCELLVAKVKTSDPTGETLVSVSTVKRSADDHVYTLCATLFSRLDGGTDSKGSPRATNVCPQECRAVASIYDTLDQMQAAPTRFNFRQLFEAATENGKIHYVLTVDDCVRCVDTHECFPQAMRQPVEADVLEPLNFYRLVKTTTTPAP